MRATAIGYQKVHSAVLDVTTSPTNVPTLTLTGLTGKLAEVRVTAKKLFVEQQLDRMVVNVAGSIVGSGSTALEVLEKSPGVTVDYQNERIQLRGKDGVIVQIDGKQSYLSAQADTSLSLLVTAAQRGGATVTNVLSGMTALTVFAPTNAAFRAAGYQTQARYSCRFNAALIN